ncbi:MAG: FmdB family zinc ribbon protein [Solirubrobacteraceae bacterium]|jgi:putative FmdB family regulatory protein
MPTYEYRCTKGHSFETVQSMSDELLETCEVCGAPVQRVMHSPAVHFKGSGFYNTDYGTRNRQREQKANADAKASDAKTATSGDAASSSSAADKPASTDHKPKPDKAPAKQSE